MARKRDVRTARQRRHHWVRRKLQGTRERPRLCVFRSLNHIYAQVTDDTTGFTIAAASTLDRGVRPQLEDKPKTEAAKLVGALVAERALQQGVTTVVFDRGGYKYHGRVRALAESAREAGLEF